MYRDVYVNRLRAQLHLNECHRRVNSRGIILPDLTTPIFPFFINKLFVKDDPRSFCNIIIERFAILSHWKEFRGISFK